MQITSTRIGGQRSVRKNHADGSLISIGIAPSDPSIFGRYVGLSVESGGRLYSVRLSAAELKQILRNVAEWDKEYPDFFKEDK